MLPGLRCHVVLRGLIGELRDLICQ
jgi:hypothetical protein